MTIMTDGQIAKRIDGKVFAQNLRDRLASAVASTKEQHGFTPGLAVVLVGDDPASDIYVTSKGKQTKEVGMNSYEYRLPDTASQDEVLALVGELNANPDVHGILVQFPVPDQISQEAVILAIDPEKDVDGLHPINAGRLASGFAAMAPCTPLGTLMLARDQFGDLSGKHAVIIGRSNLVGKPIAQLLLRENCTVTIAHSRTVDLPALCRQADILVAAVGRDRMVRGDWVKPGALVLDVGINRIPAPERGEGKTRVVGDVAYDEAVEVASAITPVPGGIGPMTIACLLCNTLTTSYQLHGLEPIAEFTI